MRADDEPAHAAAHVIELAAVTRRARIVLCLAFAAFAASMSMLGSQLSGGLVSAAARSLPHQLVRAAVVAALAAAFGWWRARPRASPAAVELGPEAVLLPRSPYDRRPLRVPYRRIDSLVWRGHGPLAKLSIGLDRGFPRQLALRWFAHAGAGHAVAAGLRERIARLPDGAARLRALDRRVRVADAAVARPPAVSLALSLLTVLVFAYQSASERPLWDPIELIRLGASATWLTPGEGWYRLFTAPLLHPHWLSLLINTSVFWLLGRRLEGLLGHWRFAIVALGSLLGGSLVGLAGGYRFAVGFSPVVMGMLGGLLLLNIRRGPELPAPYRTPLPYFLLILTAIIVFDRVSPQLDGAAHVGGLIAGALLTALLLPGLDLTRPAAKPARLVRGLACALAATQLVALGSSLGFIARTSRSDMIHRLAGSIAGFSDQLPVLVLTAMELGRLPDATRAELEAVRDALDALGAERAPLWVVQEALAVVEYRLGNAERAAKLWRPVAEASAGAGRFSTLALLTHAARRAGGGASPGLGAAHSLGVADSAAAAAVTGVRLVPVRVDTGSSTLRLELDRPAARGIVVDALVERDGALLGLLRVEAGPGEAPAVDSWRLPPGLHEQLHEQLRDASVEVVYVEDGGQADLAGGSRGPRWSWWPADPALSALPAPLPREPGR